MASLYKRATPTQRQLLKIVEGAVLNVADAHGFQRDPRLARSIAKRAAGTLSSQWTGVLAAKPSARGDGHTCLCPGPSEHSEKVSSECGRSLVVKGETVSPSDGRARRVTSQISRRHPFHILLHEISKEMRHVKQSGDQSKIDTYIYMLRKIDRLHKRLIANASA